MGRTEERKAYFKAYRQTEKYKSYQRDYRKPYEQSESRKVFREVNALKRKARRLANKAKKSGLIKQCPCVRCGAGNTQMHHEDYTKPLDVVWLCHACHVLEHVS